MLIGVPKEIKNHEYRIGLTPAGVRELVGAGQRVLRLSLVQPRYSSAPN